MNWRFWERKDDGMAVTTVTVTEKKLDKEYQDVLEFNLKFDLPAFGMPVHRPTLALVQRSDFMQEELNEFIDAAARQDLVGMADALIDIVYVAKGTAIMLGLTCWPELWDDVQRANMSKVLTTSVAGYKLGVSKPEGWQPPNTLEILMQAGYRPKDWK